MLHWDCPNNDNSEQRSVLAPHTPDEVAAREELGDYRLMVQERLWMAITQLFN